MKKKTTSLFAIGILALVISTSTVYATTNVNSPVSKNVSEELQIGKKVVISGNVNVTLVQDAECKKLFTNEGAKKVLVYEEEGIIYVTAKNKGEAANITLYVDNINRLDLTGNATLKTKNMLRVQYLQIILKENATADINAMTESTYTKLVNESALKLSGTTGSHFISTNELAILNTKNFKADEIKIEKRNVLYTK